GDGVMNQLDNCPTFYNPADPIFGFQTDSDHDGLGDDRTGLDTIPGAAAYCDPDSADDNDDGLPDDLIQVAARLDCNFTRTGIAGAASVVDSIGSLDLVATQLTDDGTADPTCTSGDPDPNNDPALPQPCPGRTNAECDSPGQPGSGVCG